MNHKPISSESDYNPATGLERRPNAGGMPRMRPDFFVAAEKQPERVFFGIAHIPASKLAFNPPRSGFGLFPSTHTL